THRSQCVARASTVAQLDDASCRKRFRSLCAGANSRGNVTRMPDVWVTPSDLRRSLLAMDAKQNATVLVSMVALGLGAMPAWAQDGAASRPESSPGTAT